jgi:hypothetical protein
MKRLAFLSLAVLLVLAVSQAPAGAQPRTYGITDTVSYTLQAYAFVPPTTTDLAKYAANAFGSRYCSGAGCIYSAAVFLPDGARVSTISLDACDTDPAANVQATLFRIGSAESANQSIIGAVTTGQPGCTVVVGSDSLDHTIDNAANSYWIEVFIDGTTSATRFQAVRVLYKLQTSPAPATATFNDVPPSHLFFPFIEALAAAGITGGCSVSPPLYCPDSPLTRGQMAVFLSRALGLHFSDQ